VLLSTIDDRRHLAEHRQAGIKPTSKS